MKIGIDIDGVGLTETMQNIFLEIDLGDLNLASLREAIKMTNPSRNDSKEKGRDE